MTDNQALELLIQFEFGRAKVKDRRLVEDSAPSSAEVYSIRQNYKRLLSVANGVALRMEKISGPGSHDPDHCYRQLLTDLLHAAHDREIVLAERERCANVAKSFASNHGMRYDGAEGWAELIAEEILKG